MKTPGTKQEWEAVANRVLKGHFDLEDWSTVRSVEIGIRGFFGEPFTAALKHVKELKKRKPRPKEYEQEESW